MGSHGANGRDFARRHKRVPCDLLVAGRACKGFATRLAPHEMFIQLAGSSLPRRGSDVLIQLRQEGTGDTLEIEAIVTRQQLTEVGEHGIHRGVEPRIQGAPPEYHSLFVDPALREDTTEVELLIELELADPDLPTSRDFAGPLWHPDPDRAAPAPACEDRLLPMSPARVRSLLLALLFLWRGPGVAAWTHGLFNFALILGAGPEVLL